MHIIEQIKGLDTHLFLIINGLHSSFFDTFMWALSAKLTWVPLYISLLYLLIRTFKKDAAWIILSVVLCIVISDQLASGLLKELVKRLRPSHVHSLKSVIHLVKGYEGGLYGFASSHASNSIGLAVISSLILRNRLYTLSIVGWAILVSYSRIYLGVHYPGDIFGGMVIGVSSAFLCYGLIQKFKPQLVSGPKVETESTQTIIPVGVLFLSLVSMLIYCFIA